MVALKNHQDQCGRSYCQIKSMNFVLLLKNWIRLIKRDGLALWFAYRTGELKWIVKLLCIFVVAYALSPIDLIHDFIPILGYLDDLILLPIMITIAMHLLPSNVKSDCRDKADKWLQDQLQKPVSYLGSILIFAIWGLFAYWAWITFV